ncbi:MAG: DUF1493 family protein [Pseudomonadota bacterium]
MAADRPAPDEAENLAFFAHQTGARVRPGAHDDLFRRYGVDGDDALEFIEAFAVRYAVDLSGYRWLFHHADGGALLRVLPLASPHRYVTRVPVSAALLAEAARRGHWPLRYDQAAGAAALARADREQAWSNRAALALVTVLGAVALFLAFAAAAAATATAADARRCPEPTPC